MSGALGTLAAGGTYFLTTNENGVCDSAKIYALNGYTMSGACFQQTTDGGHIFCSANSSSPITILKNDSTGSAQWAKVYAGANNYSYSYCTGANATDGGYVLVGNLNAKILVIKTDSTGACPSATNPTPDLGTFTIIPGSVNASYPILFNPVDYGSNANINPPVTDPKVADCPPATTPS